MLYLSTRSKTDSFTAYRALMEQRAPDGGFFVPFRLSSFSEEQLNKLSQASFSENVAFILNYFFSTELSGWDVDCLIGRNATKVTAMSRRVIAATVWNNPARDYRYVVSRLAEKLTGSADLRSFSWVRLAIRIAVLFGLHAQVYKLGAQQYDVACADGNLEGLMAAWYAKKMGLPIQVILCACNENSAPWELFHRGQLDASAPVITTSTPGLDVQIPVQLERLIFETLGYEQTQRYLNIASQRLVYMPDAEALSSINAGLFASVISNRRIESVIGSAYRSSGVLLDPYSAIAYGALQDYRTKTGENRYTLLVSDLSPDQFHPFVSKATGLTREEIIKRI